MEKIRILSLGNILVRDDGAGPYLLAVLQAYWEFPEHVELIDAGTPGFDLLPLIEDVNHIVILDAVKGPGSAGSVHCFTREDIMAVGLPVGNGPHDPNLRSVLFEAELRGTAPDKVMLVGMVPSDTSVGTELSEAVKAAVTVAEKIVVDYLARSGMRVQRRDTPLEQAMWWNKEVIENA